MSTVAPTAARSAREQNLQPIAWFWDFHTRNRLNLDPPYQRRSVWNQEYKDSFIDTVLLNFPSPAIFLYEQLDPNGIASYSVVDGKQRLTTIFEFANSFFPVSEKAEASQWQGKYFKDFSDDDKRRFWSYRFLVEYLPQTDEDYINNIFNRINKNVAKLTRQELRHARFDGPFITAAERLAEWMSQRLPNVPNIASASRRQMKDVEFVSQLLLLIEDGPSGYSQEDLDAAYNSREEDWPRATDTEDRFRNTVESLAKLFDTVDGQALMRIRFRNQADFYSLFGAISSLPDQGQGLDVTRASSALLLFIQAVEDDTRRGEDRETNQYYLDARSASNDAGPRSRRIDTIKKVLIGC